MNNNSKEIEEIKKEALIFFGNDTNIKNEIDKLVNIYKFKYHK